VSELASFLLPNSKIPSKLMWKLVNDLREGLYHGMEKIEDNLAECQQYYRIIERATAILNRNTDAANQIHLPPISLITQSENQNFLRDDKKLMPNPTITYEENGCYKRELSDKLNLHAAWRSGTPSHLLKRIGKDLLYSKEEKAICRAAGRMRRRLCSREILKAATQAG
jgi:hypothetical protein